MWSILYETTSVQASLSHENCCPWRAYHTTGYFKRLSCRHKCWDQLWRSRQPENKPGGEKKTKVKWQHIYYEITSTKSSTVLLHLQTAEATCITQASKHNHQVITETACTKWRKMPMTSNTCARDSRPHTTPSLGCGHPKLFLTPIWTHNNLFVEDLNEMLFLAIYSGTSRSG